MGIELVLFVLKLVTYLRSTRHIYSSACFVYKMKPHSVIFARRRLQRDAPEAPPADTPGAPPVDRTPLGRKGWG